MEKLKFELEQLAILEKSSEFELVLEQYLKVKDIIETTMWIGQDKKQVEKISASFYYHFAQKLLCLSEYKLCIEMLILAQKHGYSKEEIYEVIFETFIQPNLVAFLENYTENRKILEKHGYLMLDFQELKVQVVPVSENEFYIYDFEKQEFQDFINLNEETSCKTCSERVASVFYLEVLALKDIKNYKKIYILQENKALLEALCQFKVLNFPKNRDIKIFNAKQQLLEYFLVTGKDIPECIVTKKIQAFELGYEILREICKQRIKKSIQLNTLVKLTGKEINCNFDFYTEFIRINSFFIKSEDSYKAKEILINQFNKDFNEKLMVLSELEKSIVKIKIENTIKNIGNSFFKVFLLVYSYDIYGDGKYLEVALNLATKSNSFSLENSFFIYYQVVRRIFLEKNYDNDDIFIARNALYEKVVQGFRLKLGYEQEYKKLRNRVIVFTNQLLEENHAPTKIAFDACYYLQQQGKEVLLINTRECLNSAGQIYLLNTAIGSIWKVYSGLNSILYKNCNIYFYQAKQEMPNLSDIKKIMQLVTEFAPEYILNIGVNLTGDLFTDRIPTITFPMGIRSHCASEYILGICGKDDREFLKRTFKYPNNVISCDWQFDIKEQKATISRLDLAIPENKFVVTVVGNRLDAEIDDEFLTFLNKLCIEKKVFVVFISQYSFNKNSSKLYRDVFNNSTSLGYQEDLLAIMENVDCYINPKRAGGGSSAIYALIKSKPVLTLNFGDVAALMNKTFVFESYEDIYNEIMKYISDNDYYKFKKNIALKSAEGITGFEKFIKKIDSEILQYVYS